LCRRSILPVEVAVLEVEEQAVDEAGDDVVEGTSEMHEFRCEVRWDVH